MSASAIIMGIVVFLILGGGMFYGLTKMKKNST
jgi:hypothetical protein